MSGEFGSYISGYFWFQIDTGASDCEEGSDELTRLWGKFLREFAPVAKAISWSEACDSGPGDAILANIQHRHALRAALQEIEEYLKPYERVAEEAVRKEADNAMDG